MQLEHSSVIVNVLQIDLVIVIVEIGLSTTLFGAVLIVTISF